MIRFDTSQDDYRRLRPVNHTIHHYSLYDTIQANIYHHITKQPLQFIPYHFLRTFHRFLPLHTTTSYRITRPITITMYYSARTSITFDICCCMNQCLHPHQTVQRANRWNRALIGPFSTPPFRTTDQHSLHSLFPPIILSSPLPLKIRSN